MIDFQLIKDSLPFLLRGAWVTLKIAALSGIIGIALGTVLGLAQSRKNTFLYWLVTLYVTIIRGTPMLIQIAFAFYVLPQFGFSLPAFWTAVIAIGLNSAAYMSQVIRAGIGSVNRGQIEAARVLGLTTPQITRYIVLPQAFQVIIPSLGNEFITLVKDSSLASTIGVVELTKEGTFIRGRTLDALSTFAAVAIIYLIITTTLSIIINRLEARMTRHVKH
jgi:polar amino acid transport system permease protein